MFNIQTYLEKFRKLGQGEKFLKEGIVLAIKEVVGVNLETKNLVVKGGEVFLLITPAAKNSVFIKKQKVLDKIKEKTAQVILDIR